MVAAELNSRLLALRPKVKEICRISGTTGVSVGVLHRGELLMTEHFGYRNVEKKLPPNDDTIYYLASLTKSFTAAAIAILVDHGQLSWDTPISQVYEPLKKHKDPEIREKANIIDFLSHRTGLTPKNHFWSQEFGHMTLKRGETIRVVNYLDKIAPFRSQWIYSNWGYGVADILIDNLSPLKWARMIKTYILQPLSMDRTVTEMKPGLENVAEGYMTLANGDPYWVGRPDGQDGDILEGALAIQSSVRDLLRYYQGFLDALAKSDTCETNGQELLPFVDPAIMIQPHIRFGSESGAIDGSYGLGWVRVQLPCTLGAIGLNHDFVDRMPVVGKGMEKKLTCLYHQGSANSFLTAVYLLPETQSGVVILTNSMSKNDAADWLGELYLEVLLDNPLKNDYVRLAQNSAQASLGLWPAMVKELAENQIPNTPVRPFSDYVGKYYNVIGDYHLEIFVQDGTLNLRFQKKRHFAYKLTHYHYDKFSWLLTHDENVRTGRFPITRASFYLIEFRSSGDDPMKIDSVVWAHDDMVLTGETFYKRDGQRSDMLETIVPESKAIAGSHTAVPMRRTDSSDRLLSLPKV